MSAASDCEILQKQGEEYERVCEVCDHPDACLVCGKPGKKWIARITYSDVHYAPSPLCERCYVSIYKPEPLWLRIVRWLAGRSLPKPPEIRSDDPCGFDL
jgi:hypothetical protein